MKREIKKVFTVEYNDETIFVEEEVDKNNGNKPFLWVYVSDCILFDTFEIREKIAKKLGIEKYLIRLRSVSKSVRHDEDLIPYKVNRLFYEVLK